MPWPKERLKTELKYSFDPVRVVCSKENGQQGRKCNKYFSRCRRDIGNIEGEIWQNLKDAICQPTRLHDREAAMAGIIVPARWCTYSDAENGVR